MREELPCKVGCRIKLDAESAKKFKEKIDDEYRANMYVSLVLTFNFVKSNQTLRNISTGK